MAKIQTLEELKRENAAENQAEVEEPQATEVEEDQAEVETETEETETAAETETEESEAEEIEPWMIGDDEASQDSEVETVPLKTLVKTRTKLKGERDKLKEEVEKLNQQLNAKPVVEESAPSTQAIPKLEDFDFDEGKYAQAMADYQSAQIDAKLKAHNQTAAQQQQQQAQKASIDKSVDDHYQRAEVMIKTNGISPDVYKASELKVREMANAVFPGQGDDTIDSLIDTIGEGSEKFIHAAGRNSQLLAEFESALRSNPLKAVALASRKAAEFNMPSKRKSTAPAPAKQISSSTDTSTNSSSLKKYKAAHKKGDQSGAFAIRQAAKKAGEDVSKW